MSEELKEVMITSEPFLMEILNGMRLRGADSCELGFNVTMADGVKFCVELVVNAQEIQ